MDSVIADVGNINDVAGRWSELKTKHPLLDIRRRPVRYDRAGVLPKRCQRSECVSGGRQNPLRERIAQIRSRIKPSIQGRNIIRCLREAWAGGSPQEINREEDTESTADNQIWQRHVGKAHTRRKIVEIGLVESPVLTAVEDERPMI